MLCLDIVGKKMFSPALPMQRNIESVRVAASAEGDKVQMPRHVERHSVEER